MDWKDSFKEGFDNIYSIMKIKYPDIRFPCYGGRFYWFLISRHFESLHFYLTQSSIIYTASSAYVTEIPFDAIKKISIKQGLFVKSSFHIRIVADKRYHFIIKKIDYLSTKLTGDNIDNLKLFIDTLQSEVGKNKN